MAVEQVAVVLSGFVVPGPDAFFHGGKDRLDAVIRFVCPEVEVPVGRLPVAPCFLKPAMIAGGVLNHQLDHHMQTQLLGLFQHIHDIGEVAEAWVDLQVIADIVAGVAKRRLVERHQPDGRGAQAADIVQALGDAAQIAASVTIDVEKQRRVDLIDHRVSVPEWSHISVP